MTKSKSKNWEWWHYGILSIVIVVCGVMLSNSALALNPVQSWWLVMALLLVFLLTAGHGITGSWRGAFIDNRNLMSLSRFQMIAWTILLLSAFAAAAIWNVFHTQTDAPLDIQLPSILWLLMGISTTSLVGSPLILSGKKELHPDRTEMSQTFELLKQQGYDEGQLNNQGQLVINSSPQQARWTDLFTGEETGNFAHLDLARLQMFFFTLVSILIYGVAIGHMLGEVSVTSEAIQQGKNVITKFPELSEGLVALIGISHTGYLAAKAVSSSQSGTQQENEQQMPAVEPSDDQPAVG
jgi:hypothetical protein